MKYPIILSLIILLVCLVYSFYFQIEPQVDAAAYDMIAVNIAEGRGYVELLDRPLGMDRDIVHIGHAYTVFLALIYKTFGHHYSVVWVFQALLHSLTCLLLFFVCLNVFTPHLLRGNKGINPEYKEKGAGFRKDISKKIGLLAMGLYGFWPDLVESTAMLITETFFLFLAILIIYLIVKFFQNPNIKKVIFISIIISVGVFTRPTILLFALVLAIVVFFKKDLEKKYVYIALFILIPLIAMSFWMYRNYLKYDRFVFVTTGGYDLWIGNNLQANGEMEVSQEIRDYFAEYGFVNIDKKGISEVRKFALEHPFDFLKLQLIKTSKYFSLIRPSGWWSHLNKVETALTIGLSGLFGAIAFVFGISGFWHALKKKNVDVKHLHFFHRLLFYLAICGPIAVIPIVVGTRYRFQLYPFLAIFAAYFLVSWFLKKRQNLYKIPLVIFIIFLLNSASDLIANFDVFLEHLHRII